MQGREGCMREEKPGSPGGGCDTRDPAPCGNSLPLPPAAGFGGGQRSATPPLRTASQHTLEGPPPPPRAGCRASAPPASRTGNVRRRSPQIITSLHLTCPTREIAVRHRRAPTLHPAPSPPRTPAGAHLEIADSATSPACHPPSTTRIVRTDRSRSYLSEQGLPRRRGRGERRWRGLREARGPRQERRACQRILGGIPAPLDPRALREGPPGWAAATNALSSTPLGPHSLQPSRPPLRSVLHPQLSL